MGRWVYRPIFVLFHCVWFLFFNSFQTYIEVFTKLNQANPCAIVMSIVGLIMLVLIAELNDLQAQKSWCRKEGRKGKKLPIPSELFVVSIRQVVGMWAKIGPNVMQPASNKRLLD